MKTYNLIGYPIAHSLSPAMMNLSFQKLGIFAEYKLRECKLPQLESVLDLMKSEGVSGWNVTMPLKSRMAELCDKLSYEAAIGRSVNTVVNENGCLHGYSTDGAGFIHAIKRCGYNISGNNVTLIGGGGAASSILISSAISGAKKISVYLRSKRNLPKLEDIASKLSGISGAVISFRLINDDTSLRADLASSSILVNASSAGMNGGPSEGISPIKNPAILPDGIFVYDIVYNPLVTPLMRQAKDLHLKYSGGLGMLIGQGEESFAIWTGRTMPYDDVYELLDSRLG